MLHGESRRESTNIEVHKFFCFFHSSIISRAAIAVLLLIFICFTGIVLIIFLNVFISKAGKDGSETLNDEPASATNIPVVALPPINNVTAESLEYFNTEDHHSIPKNVEVPSISDNIKETNFVSDAAEKTTTFNVPSGTHNTGAPKNDTKQADISFTLSVNLSSVSNESATPEIATTSEDSAFTPRTKEANDKPNITSSLTDLSEQNEKSGLNSYLQAFYGKNSYLLFGTRRNLNDAKETCKRFNATLIYIENNEEEEMFNDLVLDKMSLVTCNPCEADEKNESSYAMYGSMMWTAGYVSSASPATVLWNDISIKTKYERLCQGEIRTVNAKLKLNGKMQTQETYLIVKDFSKSIKIATKWRETHCWRLFEDTMLLTLNASMHFACKSLIHNTPQYFEQRLNSQSVKLLTPLRQLNFFTFASFKGAEAICSKSNSTLVSIDSYDDEEAIDRRVMARREEFLSDPTIPSEELWNTWSPWMVWTSGFYDLSSESMFPWKWANRDRVPPAQRAYAAGQFCQGAVDRATAFWKSSLNASSIVHIVKDYSKATSCWELLDPDYAVQRNYELPVICQSKIPSLLLKDHK